MSAEDSLDELEHLADGMAQRAADHTGADWVNLGAWSSLIRKAVGEIRDLLEWDGA